MTAAVKIQEVQRDFGRAAHTYDTYATLQHEVLEQAVGLLAPCLGQTAKVLDAGCGTGRALDMVTPLIPGGGIIGLDIAAPMCAQAARRGMAAACADIQQLPLQDTSMDAVLCSLVMQWVWQRDQAFSEFFRVVRPGGHMALSIFGERTLAELRSVCGETRVHTFPTLQALLAEARAAGWNPLQEFSRCTLQHYPSLPALMDSLKAIGATNKLPGRKRGLSTPSAFHYAAEQYHRQFGSGQGIFATWEVHTLLLQKP